MARSNATTKACFKAAMGISAEETTKLGERADKYATTDIAADWASAVQDMIEEYLVQYNALEKAVNEAEGTKFSKNGGSGQKHTVQSLTKSLTDFMNVDKLGRNIVVVGSAADLSDVRDLVAFNTKDAIAWTRGGKAYLIADRIAKGDERAVFLHEVGSHLGLDRLLPQGLHTKLADQIREWAARADGSQESKIAQKAMDRAAKAGTAAEDLNSEHIAYFIEEAMKSGMNPSAFSPEMQNWWRTLWSAFKSAVRHLMGRADLNAQDVLNLAMGAARLEVNGNWHGTAAAFRNFNHAFMGSGEGAQAFGWGTYTADKRGIGKGYMDRDVDNKQTHIHGYFRDPKIKKSLDALAAKVLASDVAVDRIVTLINSGTKWFDLSVRQVLGIKDSMFYGMNYHALLLQDAAKLAKDRAWASTLQGGNSKVTPEQVREALSTIINSKPTEGSLMRTDRNARDSEMIDWYAPMAEQSDYVKQKLADNPVLIDKEGAGLTPDLLALESEVRNGRRIYYVMSKNYGYVVQTFTDEQDAKDFIAAQKGVNEPKTVWESATSGESLYKLLEDHFGSDQAASVWLRSIGIKGIKQLDSTSRKDNAREWVDYPNKQELYGLFNGVSADTAVKYNLVHIEDFVYDLENGAAKGNLHNVIKALQLPEEAKQIVEDYIKWKNAPVDRTYNHIMFSDKDNQRVATLIGADSSKVKFSKAVDAAIQQTANAANSQYADAVEGVRAMMSEKTKDTWATITDAFRKFAPAFLSNYQLVEQYGKKFKAKSLERYVGLQQKMTQERTQQAMKFHNIAVEWDKLAEGTKERLNKLMLRATLDQIHPDEAFTPGQKGTPNGHLTEADRAKYDQLRVQYNALGDKAQKVYRDAKQALADQWKDRREAYRKLVDYTFSGRMADAMKRNDLEAYAKLEQDSKDALAAYDKQLDQLKGPYFPLMRFGTYLAIGESSELVALKDKIKDAVGDERRKLEAQLESMKKDPKHYEVSAHESRGQLNRATRALRDRGLVPREDMTDQNLDGVSRDSARIVAEIGHMVTANFDGDIAQQVNDGLANVYLRSLPEMHALRREAHRKGIEGANPDMLRAFASAGQSGSFYQSRLRHAPEMADAMFQMKREAKGNIDMQHIHREMEKRMALDMQFKETPVQDLVASASWVYHLGMSPSNWVLNATQPWLVSAPMMAGKFGMARASAELGRAYTDAAKIMKDARFKGDKIDWWSGISEDSLTNRDERKALRALMERGIVDEGLQHELNMFADGKSRGLAAFNRWMGWGNQQVELVNRTTTALAAFRLATKSGMKYDEALDYAYKTTLNSQFDYSQEGTARFMREGGGVPMAKLVFQFRKFQQGMLYALGSNIRKLANPEERKEAAYTLAYLSATSGLVAGATGLPFAAVVYGIANAFLDDDDPEGDAETQFANWLYDVTGDKKAADVLRKGLPALWGWDVSKRVGMGDVASLFPMGRFDGKTGQEFGGQVAMAAMGPAAGLAARMYDGAVLIGEGEFQRGSEKMLPKVAADMMKALRYGTEGMSDGKGNPTGTQYDAIDIASKAFGFNPVKESDYYEGTAAVKNTQSAVKDRIGRIGNQFKEAVRDGDMADVREAIAKFNEDHPENPITPKQELQWRKDARESGKNRTEAGVKMGNKKDGIYNPVARFAQ